MTDSKTEATQKPAWWNAMIAEAMRDAKRLGKSRVITARYQRYQTDPLGFCTEVLGEYITDDCRRVIQSVYDNPVTIARSASDIGKSFSAASIALWFFRVFDDAKVYITAAPPLENLKRILWGEMLKKMEINKKVFHDFRKKTLAVYRDPASFIWGVSIPSSGSMEEREAKFSGKHAPHLLFIVDEGDAVPPEVYAGIEACMSGGFARLLIMFNPRMAAGPVYLKEAQHSANVVEMSAFTHPNVVTGQDVIPGAVTRETTARRINQWTRELREKEVVDSACFEVPSFMINYTATALDGKVYPPIQAGFRKISDPAFSYMVLGKYPMQSESQLISREYIERAQRNWKEYVERNGEIPPSQAPLMGMDVAEFGSDYNVIALRYGNFVARFNLWNGVDPVVSSSRVFEINQTKIHADMILVDATAVGASVPPLLTRLFRDAPGKPRIVPVKVASKPSPSIKSELGEFFQMRDQIWWAMREWLKTNENACLPPDGYLAEELAAVSYEITEGGKIKIENKERIRDKLRRSPDRADALSLTFFPMPRPKIVRLSD